MASTFFSFRHIEKCGEPIALSRGCEVKGEINSFAASYIKDSINKFGENGRKFDIVLSKSIPDSIRVRLGDKYREHKESYAILADAEAGIINLHGSSHRGLIYAVSTLIQLVDGNEICEDLFLFDYPDMDVRGYRVYTPSRGQMETFKAMVDKLIYYKYNSLIIEVGGAMEYKRHPEINEEWVEFCKEVGVSPDVAKRIQSHTYPWRKDSIHFENGEGGFITQDEMRELVSYCKEREFTVIPEVPTLSHADYIVRAFPELNERVEDAYPDTYCPSNPKTYEIVFDIIDEVVDVFKPEYVNIGHDEYYTAAICPLCKDKSPVDLYVGDIIKINDYLKSKSIKSMMWADKFFGDPVTGNAYPQKFVPDLMGCRGKVPTDVILLNWAWPNADHSQEHLLKDLGYELIFGNFDAISRPGYRDDNHLHGGGFVSNWGSFDEKYMQRNQQNFWLANTAYVFWSADYTNNDAPALYEKVRRELYNNYKRTLGDSIIEICHTTAIEKKYIWFWCGIFIVDSDWLIGNHKITYTDGTEAELPVIYGYNIRGCDAENSENFRDIDEDFNTNTDGRRVEVIGASYPFLSDGKVWYKAAYKNPHPDKEIAYITPAKDTWIKG